MPGHGALNRRLAAASAQDPETARADLQQAAREVAEGPAFELMQTLCRTLADPRRLRIAALLKRQPDLSGVELQVALGISQATTSHHLRVLKDAGIVRSTKDVKWVRYRIDPGFSRLVP